MNILLLNSDVHSLSFIQLPKSEWGWEKEIRARFVVNCVECALLYKLRGS